MEQKTDNLQAKCIKDFTKEDTIYIRVKSGRDNSVLFLCQFEKYEGRDVYGTVIRAIVNPSLHKSIIGETVNARLNNCALYGKHPVTDHKSYHFFKGSGYAIYDRDYKKESDNDDITEQHESYGMIRVTRRNSRGEVLFGSSINHHEVMSITVTKGEVERKLGREWHHNGEPLIELEMSPSQFCEMITSPNMGSGVPCTLRRVGKVPLLDPPYENKRMSFIKEFKNTMNNMSVDLVENEKILQSILSKKSINKGDREEIGKLFSTFISTIQSSLPFMQESFNEQMDKTVMEAKGEVEMFINRRLTEEGRKALGSTGDRLLLD